MVTAMIVPCYNEASRFPGEYWENILLGTSFQWIFVNDGSSDKTDEVLEGIKSENVRILSLKNNLGKGEAIRLGVLEALKLQDPIVSVIGYIDSDGAFTLEDILNLEEMALRDSNSRMIWSSRVALSGNNIQRSFKRHYLGRVISTLIWLGNKSTIYDTQSGLKFIPLNENVKEMFSEPFRTRWFVDLEIYARWCEMFEAQQVVIEVPLREWREKPGSKIRVSQFISILKEVLYINRELRKVRR